MSNLAIKVEGLSKRYRIGVREERPETLLGAVGAWVKSSVSNFRRLRKLSTFDQQGGGHDIIWALKDIRFGVKPGEVVGVIGRNGAGKTTLLRILSHIAEPTVGKAVINGRVASLLAVGTGFHGELTGRENVYLNGTILGMSKAEVDRKFAEIVAFSGVEAFIDTPVKRYSSGMSVRLGFAVAAHLEPEILLIDEVLAVGDIGFQKKCLGKMEEVASQGRTVLFVSHNMQMIDNLCPRTILLEGGRVVADGPTAHSMDRYYDLVREREEEAQVAISEHADQRGGSGKVRFTHIRGMDIEGRERFEFRSGEAIVFRFDYKVLGAARGLKVYMAIKSRKSKELLTDFSHVVTTEQLAPGQTGSFSLEIETQGLRPGTYPLRFDLGGVTESLDFEDRLSYDIVNEQTFPLVIFAEKTYQRFGFVDVASRLVASDQALKV